MRLFSHCFVVIAFFSAMLLVAEDSYVNESGCWIHPGFQQQANIQDRSLYDAAMCDRIGFWEECGRNVHWFSNWSKSFEWSCPYSKWYIDGKLNLSYNCLDKHLQNNGNKTAFIWCNERGEELRISYAQMHREVCKLANGLKSLGIRKGDIVVIYMPMTIEGIASMLACSRIGAVHSVVFAGSGAGSIKEKINDAQAKMVITADVTYRRGRAIPLCDTIDQVIEDCHSVNNVVVLQRESQRQRCKNAKYVDYAELIEQSSSVSEANAMDSEEMSFVLYTSGTTGKPKGIVHSTGGYLVGVHNTYKWVFDCKPKDVFWCTADIGWITGHSYVVYGPMSNGVTQVIYEGTFDYPSKEQAWKIIEKYGVNVFYTAPTLIRTFMKWGSDRLQQYNLSSLRLLGSIGEPLNPEAWDWYHHYVGNKHCPIVDTWFQTETGALVIAPLPGVTPLKPGSITQPLPGFEAAILNDDGKAVDHGFLSITSPYPSMMRGLLNNPQRYYETYWEKWNGTVYYAGDDATRDKDNYFWVRGRADEVIKVCGHRIGTAETENVIIDVPGVSESAVIGVFDEIKGQKIVALVVLKENVLQNTAMSDRIKKQVSEHIGKYAQPEVVVFVRDLPKTRSGKILRRVIANLIERKPMGDVTTLQNPDVISELQVVCNEIASGFELKASL